MVLAPSGHTGTLAIVIIIILTMLIYIHTTLLASLTIDSEADHTQEVAFWNTFQARLAAVKICFLA